MPDVRESVAVPLAGGLQPVDLAACVDRRCLLALRRMALGVAHDLNNALAALMGNLAALQRELPNDGAAPQRVERAQQAAKGVLELADALLSLCGRAALVRGPLDAAALLQAVAQTDTAALDGAVGPPCVPMLAVAAELPAAVGDARRLESLLSELVANARASRRGATVRLGACGAALDGVALARGLFAEGARPGRYLLFAVRDDGEGLSPERLGEAFLPFQSARMRSRGLGLAVAHGLAEAHGGGLLLWTAPGRGTCVAACLPVS